MKLKKYQDMVMINLIEPMISFMEDLGDCDYTADDINRCKDLIFNYLDALDDMATPSDTLIMEQVESLVLALNELNEEFDFIETMEREAIWEIIQNSAIEYGLSEYDDDITGQWREW